MPQNKLWLTPESGRSRSRQRVRSGHPRPGFAHKCFLTIFRSGAAADCYKLRTCRRSEDGLSQVCTGRSKP